MRVKTEQVPLEKGGVELVIRVTDKEKGISVLYRERVEEEITAHDMVWRYAPMFERVWLRMCE